MELLEYQTKDLFRQAEIPVLPSQCLARPGDLKYLTIDYPIVLKPQLLRKRHVPVLQPRKIDNTVDAIAVAQMLFSQAVSGEYPQLLLAEAFQEVMGALSLAIAVDPSRGGPVLYGQLKSLGQYGPLEDSPVSRQICEGGLQVQPLSTRFSSHYARRLCVAMGLAGDLLRAVSAIVERMYMLFARFDLDLIEIDPLGIMPNGEPIALDGRIGVNVAALGRHPELMALKPPQSDRLSRRARAQQRGMRLLKFSSENGPRLALLANGFGLLVAGIDTLQAGGLTPYLALDICTRTDAESLSWALELLVEKETPDYVAIDLIGTVTSCRDMAEAIAKFQVNLSRRMGDRRPKLLVKLRGWELEIAREYLLNAGILTFTDIGKIGELYNAETSEQAL